MKKNIFLIGVICSILIPINVSALTGSVSLSCDKTKLKPNEETTCSVKANTNDEVSAVGARIVLGSNLTLTSVTTDSAWQGDGNDGNIQLYIGENKKGNFNIATFKVKAGSVNTGADTIKEDDYIIVDNIKYTKIDEKEIHDNIKIIYYHHELLQHIHYHNI